MQGQSQQKLGWLWSIYLLFLKLPHSSPWPTSSTVPAPKAITLLRLPLYSWLKSKGPIWWISQPHLSPIWSCTWLHSKHV